MYLMTIMTFGLVGLRRHESWDFVAFTVYNLQTCILFNVFNLWGPLNQNITWDIGNFPPPPTPHPPQSTLSSAFDRCHLGFG